MLGSADASDPRLCCWRHGHVAGNSSDDLHVALCRLPLYRHSAGLILLKSFKLRTIEEAEVWNVIDRWCAIFYSLYMPLGLQAAASSCKQLSELREVYHGLAQAAAALHAERPAAVGFSHLFQEVSHQRGVELPSFALAFLPRPRHALLPGDPWLSLYKRLKRAQVWSLCLSRKRLRLHWNRSICEVRSHQCGGGQQAVC